MDRSLWAVLGGTFTLRFTTGLTGTMLAVYLAKLPEHGGPVVAATTLGLLHSTFYLSELVLSPIFGVLSDRFGHHRMMLVGPVVRRRRGDPHRADDEPPRPRRDADPRRRVDGRQHPSILGYIALVTAGNELLRGQAAARFEGATLAGIGVGLVARAAAVRGARARPRSS